MGQRLLYSQTPPGEKLLYSQFLGVTATMGGKAFIQQLHYIFMLLNDVDVNKHNWYTSVLS